jgi:hypothetical protein
VTGKDIDGYLVRTTPDGSVDFRIADAVVRAISMEVMRGFGVTRRRGAEVGGLLLGSARKGVVVVEDCEIVPCEYAYGPSYLLSDNDAPKFAEAVQRWRAVPGADKYVVGFFRSHTREGLQPDAPDLELFHMHFPGPGAALLLIKPYATRPSDAVVFMPADGRLSTEPHIAFTFAPSAAAPPAEPGHVRHSGDGPPTAAIAEPAAPAPAPVVKRAFDQPIILPRIPTERERLLTEVLGPKETPEPPRRVTTDRELFSEYVQPTEKSPLRFVIWALFIASAVMFGYALGYRQAGGNLAAMMPWAKPAPAKDVYGLGLHARARGDSILVQWDRSSDAIRSAQGGVTVIASPSGRQEIQMSASELKTGVLLYKTDATEADIRLEVFVATGRSVAEQTLWKRSSTVEQ